MGYDVKLVHPVTGLVLQLDQPHHMRGGTYAVGGTTDAALNITSNYGEILRRVLGGGSAELTSFEKMFGGGETGIRLLYGKTAAETIPMLQAAIGHLGDDVNENYWTATEGNVKSALLKVLALAQMRPDGVWAGD